MQLLNRNADGWQADLTAGFRNLVYKINTRKETRTFNQPSRLCMQVRCPRQVDREGKYRAQWHSTAQRSE